LIETLLREVADARVEGVAAGLHLVLRLPDDLHEEDIVRGLATHRIRVRGIDEYRLDRSREGLDGPALVLGFGRLPEPSVPAVVRALRTTVSDVRRSHSQLAAG
jgi:GntR family transcriptional regulator/MocR family aminotransferase